MFQIKQILKEIIMKRKFQLNQTLKGVKTVKRNNITLDKKNKVKKQIKSC